MYKKNNYKKTVVLLAIFSCGVLVAQLKVPKSYSNIYVDSVNKLYFKANAIKYYASERKPAFTYQQLFGNPVGTENGILLDFKEFEGTITYGLIPYQKAPHPLPVFRFTQKLIDGKVTINIRKNFKYPYDFVGWSESKPFTIGYRLIDKYGMIVFDGEVSASGIGPFKTLPAIYEGPFINKVSPTSATVWYKTTKPVKSKVIINGKNYGNDVKKTHHEITIKNLSPDTRYNYTVNYGILSQSYHFKTAPVNGSRKPFIFAYTSDSRHATGSGERMVYGANAYILKKMAAVAYSNNASFVQFTGDMINGYLTSKELQHIQLTNWKKSVEPFWHYIPFNVGQGNHEALGYTFKNEKGKTVGFIDRFPYSTQSAEAVMQEAFVNPENGPDTEDGNKYDLHKNSVDFPSYKESVFYYVHGNVAMIVLNSNYWFAPTMKKNTATSGGLHGYIMDNQLKWLQKTIIKLENNNDIDHIFVTQHTPAFPNGGHSKDDMWYHGNNKMRPYVSGKPVDKGIIERRDEYLDILANQSTKVVAILTGDEHNYNWLKLTNEVPIYPANYPHKKLSFSRPIYQINNGASGAPYYAQEKLPWSKFTQSFSVENAVCLFYVDGKSIKMKVINPDTLNVIDQVKLK